MEQEMMRDDGGIVPVQDVAMSFGYDGEPATLSILHDLTERKRAEAFGDELVFNARDNGAGFAPAYAGRMFGVPNACTRRTSSKAPASAWQSCGAVWNAMAGASGRTDCRTRLTSFASACLHTGSSMMRPKARLFAPCAPRLTGYDARSGSPPYQEKRDTMPHRVANGER